MGFWDPWMTVYVCRGGDERKMALKTGRRDGAYLVDTSAKGHPVAKRFDPYKVDVVYEADRRDGDVIAGAVAGGILAGSAGAVVGGMAGLGRRGDWYVRVWEHGVPYTLMRMPNEQAARIAEKRIGRIIRRASDSSSFAAEDGSGQPAPPVYPE